MAYQFYNPNPLKNIVGDCVIRAITKALNSDWYSVYSDLTIQGYALCDMPSSNAVWGQYLKSKGYRRQMIPNTCPDCYTIKDFCEEHPQGKFIVGTGTHLVCIEDGTLFDSWDSSNETPIFYFTGE